MLTNETARNTNILRVSEEKKPRELALRLMFSAPESLKMIRSASMKTERMKFEMRERNDVLLKSNIVSSCSIHLHVT